jgi:trans-aconitate 2-methyltransferase
MPWSPDTYNKFKAERYAPFFDLLALIHVKSDLTIIDLGCGTGELTGKLADALPGSTVLGIDSSDEMLEEAEDFIKENVTFRKSTIEDVVQSGIQWDLVFSNAAIQWVENHEELLPNIIKSVKIGGQMAIQLPSNHNHYTHLAIKEVASMSPFNTALKNWVRTVPVLSIEDYSNILFKNGVSAITVFEKIYPHVLKDSNAMVDWVSGTALVPYMERLPKELHEPFMTEYREKVQAKFPEKPVFYPFKRTFIYGTLV